MDAINRSIESIAEGMFLTATMSNKLIFAQKAREGMPGLPASRILVLTILNKKGPQTISKVADHISYSKQSMTTIVDQMENDGMVERVPDTTDRRVTLLKITTKGIEALNQNRELAKERLKEGLSQLEEKDIERLEEAFQTVLQILPFAKLTASMPQNKDENTEN
ncbi:MAG TPA: MarR family transcriptional regulator [Methanomassiliicoccales archaeon]|jgi:DNA-binding MarR family transcriptional regulator